MHVGSVRVGVPGPGVAVFVGVRLAGRIGRTMDMPVMLVVHVSMGVLDRRMLMSMLMSFSQVQPDPEHHESAGHDQLDRDRLPERTAAAAPRNGAEEK
jgi:hypothetical protein